MTTDDARALAQRVRAACAAAAARAFEEAGVQGLCAEGRCEAAVSAIERIDLEPLLAPAAAPSTQAPAT